MEILLFIIGCIFLVFTLYFLKDIIDRSFENSVSHKSVNLLESIYNTTILISDKREETKNKFKNNCLNKDDEMCIIISDEYKDDYCELIMSCINRDKMVISYTSIDNNLLRSVTTLLFNEISGTGVTAKAQISSVAYKYSRDLFIPSILLETNGTNIEEYLDAFGFNELKENINILKDVSSHTKTKSRKYSKELNIMRESADYCIEKINNKTEELMKGNKDQQE